MDPQEILDVFQSRKKHLRDKSLEVAEAAVSGMEEPSEEEEEPLIARVLPVVEAAQKATVAMTDGYLAVFLGKPPVGLTTKNLVGAALRNGSDPREVYHRPTVTWRTGLSKGRPPDLAKRAAVARLKATVDTDLQLAHRAAAREIFARRNVRFYRRVTTRLSCGLCGSLTSKRYRASTLLPIHGGCDCSIAPIVDGFDPRDAAVLGEDPIDPTVHEHGELGPYLAQAGHHFTGPSDLP